jgi:hypothetical protein
MKIYKHKIRGGYYIRLFHARLQINCSYDMAHCVVYMSLKKPFLWVRPASDFYDGRFKRITLWGVINDRYKG